MPYTLDNLINDCREELAKDNGPGSRGQICKHVAKALKDDSFIARHIPTDSQDERNVLYEDPDHGFCICAHVYRGAKNSQPHDHGPTWAIYGQASGITTMTDWKIAAPASANSSAKVTMGKKYTMNPGDVHLYEVGDVHAPYRDGPTRLLRIEGQDTMKVTRTAIEVMAL